MCLLSGVDIVQLAAKQLQLRAKIGRLSSIELYGVLFGRTESLRVTVQRRAMQFLETVQFSNGFAK